jgi:PAS domain S-box-containing protein
MDTSDALYRELVECQQDLLVKFSPEGRLLFVNTAYCKTMGKTREELDGGVFMPASSEKYSDVLATQMTKLFRSPYSCTVEQWVQSPKKGMQCISWAAKSILDDQKNVIAIIATGHDITRFRQDKKPLRKGDDDLMLVVESGKQLYYSHSPDHVMMYVSPRIRTLLGCKAREGRKSWTDFLTDNPMNAQGLERTLRALSYGRREPPYRLEMKTGDGRNIWVEVNEIPVVRQGKTVAIAGFMEDVTEKMYVEEGEAEAKILFKGVRGPVEKDSGSAGFGFIRSIFSKDKDAAEEETV